MKEVTEALRTNLEDVEICTCASSILKTTVMNAENVGGLHTFLKDVSGFDVLMDALKKYVPDETICGNIVKILFFVINNYAHLEKDHVAAMINKNNVVEQIIKVMRMHVDIREIESDCVYILETVIRGKISTSTQPFFHTFRSFSSSFHFISFHFIPFHLEEKAEIEIKPKKLRQIASLHQEDKGLFEKIENLLYDLYNEDLGIFKFQLLNTITLMFFFLN